VQEDGKNPMRLDIYAGEEQTLAIGHIHQTAIEICSERDREPARVFLARKKYTGTLKLVCLDCASREFRFTLDPSYAKPFVVS
jgi:hypothetical protein